jgi:hypothetical protein
MGKSVSRAQPQVDALHVSPDKHTLPLDGHSQRRSISRAGVSTRSSRQNAPSHPERLNGIRFPLGWAWPSWVSSSSTRSIRGSRSRTIVRMESRDQSQRGGRASDRKGHGITDPLPFSGIGYAYCWVDADSGPQAGASDVHPTSKGHVSHLGQVQRAGYPILSQNPRFQALFLDLWCQVCSISPQPFPVY